MPRFMPSIMKSPPPKPRLRGVSHQFAAVAALVGGIMLVLSAPTAAANRASAIYSAALVLLFTTSAVYHSPTWQPTVRAWLRRLDHASIFVLIAATYTPICMLALRTTAGPSLLLLIWGGAALGVLQSLIWVRAPKPFSALVYLMLGWGVLPYLPQLMTTLQTPELVLLAIGGLIYSSGAVIYAMHWPNPLPKIFGYHEIFHLCVICASICHFAAIYRLVQRG